MEGNLEGNFREGMNASTGAEQTSFGGQLDSSFDTGSAGAEATNGSTQASADNSANSSSGGMTNRVKSVASSVKGKASAIPSMLADGLEAGAQALRQRKPAISGASSGSAAVADDSSISAVTDTLATGMQSSAEWLRDADLDKLKEGVEKQVKEHPARSLLVALGAGYLIGKALRR
jgi:hypothetical protein